MEKKWPSDQTMDKAANDLAKLSLQGNEAAWQRLYKAIEECCAPLKAKNKAAWWLVTLQMQVRAPLPEVLASPCCVMLQWHNPETKLVLVLQLTESRVAEIRLFENGVGKEVCWAQSDDDRPFLAEKIGKHLKRVFPEK